MPSGLFSGSSSGQIANRYASDCAEPRAIAPFAHTARAWALYGQQVFSRYVEIGRVCLINYGPDQGKLCTSIDVVDSNKALIDGPKDLTGVVRQMIPFKRLSLTDLIAKVRSRARPGQALSSDLLRDLRRRGRDGAEWIHDGAGVHRGKCLDRGQGNYHQGRQDR